MKVVFDAQAFSFQEYGGITRYFTHLYESFVKMPDVAPALLLKYSNNHYLRELGLDAAPFFANHRFKGRNEIIKMLNRRYVKKRLGRMHAPYLFHPTYYDPYFLECIDDHPFVMTVYDMSHELYPDMFAKLDFTAAQKKKSIPAAHRLIAISQHTKNDLMRLYGIPDERIDVIYLANSLSAAHAADRTAAGGLQGLPDRYVLFVGTRKAYKNFTVLLHAMASLPAGNRATMLFCAGGGKFTSEELQEFERLGMSHRVRQQNVNDAELAVLYANAEAFVFPSLYEGFGIPVLEAFACGCPAILSDRSSLPEVGGGAAEYFDPENIDNLAAVVSRVLNDRTLADLMRARGAERVRQFSWDATALNTRRVYEKIQRMRE
jgi:glycosyltransferase involved in cell wall biosynthesis